MEEYCARLLGVKVFRKGKRKTYIFLLDCLRDKADDAVSFPLKISLTCRRGLEEEVLLLVIFELPSPPFVLR